MSIQLVLALSWSVVATGLALHYRAQAKKRASKFTAAHDAELEKHERLLGDERKRSEDFKAKAQMDAELISQLTNDLVTAHEASRMASEDLAECRKTIERLTAENLQLREALLVREQQLQVVLDTAQIVSPEGETKPDETWVVNSTGLTRKAKSVVKKSRNPQRKK